MSDRPSMSQVIKWTASKVPDAATWRDALNEAERIILAFAESYWRDRIAQEIEALTRPMPERNRFDYGFRAGISRAARVARGASPVPTERICDCPDDYDCPPWPHDPPGVPTEPKEKPNGL